MNIITRAASSNNGTQAQRGPIVVLYLRQRCSKGGNLSACNNMYDTCDEG